MIFKKKKKEVDGTFKSNEVIFLIVVTCVVSCCMGGICTLKYQQQNNYNTNDESLKNIIDNYNYIIDNYYGDVDQKILAEGAINGMVEALGDDYSNVIDENSKDNFNKLLAGSFKGIGVEVTNNKEGNIEVLYVFENSPADKAGVKAGDKIVKIDNNDFKGKNINELTKYIKEKNKIKMTVERNGEQQSFDLSKATIIIKSVYSEMIEKNNKKIAYVIITTFSNTTYNQFKEILENFEKQGFDSLVIDVRNNSGGHLTAVENMLSLFLDKTNIIYQTETKTAKNKIYSTGKTTTTYPIVVIQNGDSASASEMLTSALQEQYGATVVGTNSFGKGTVQELVNLAGQAEYKFTTKKWLTPKGNWINEVGIKPDIEVELSDQYIAAPSHDTDNQLQAALEAATK